MLRYRNLITPATSQLFQKTLIFMFILLINSTTFVVHIELIGFFCKKNDRNLSPLITITYYTQVTQQNFAYRRLWFRSKRNYLLLITHCFLFLVIPCLVSFPFLARKIFTFTFATGAKILSPTNPQI